MIKVKHLITENKASYIGDCKSIIDTCDIFSNATEMAQSIENSEPMTYNEFISSVNFHNAPRMFVLNLRKNPDWFTFGKHKNLIWAYCSEKDTHFFFV